MGTWSIPWDTLERAQEFRVRMAKPWIAAVKAVTHPSYGPNQQGDTSKMVDGVWRRFRDGQEVPATGSKIVYEWEAEGLYGLFGDDELFDDLGVLADDTRAEFDVRQLVRERLGELVADLTEAGEVEPEGKPAFNVIREVLWLDPI